MLDDGGDDDVVGAQAEPVGEMVDGLSGVAADDRHVRRRRRGAREPEDGGASMLVGVGGGAGLVAGAAMHTGVPGEEFVDSRGDGGQGVRGGGAVEVEVAPVRAVDARHFQLVADEWDGNGEGHGSLRGARVARTRASMAILSPSSVGTGRSTRVALTMSSPSRSAATSSGP